MPLYPAQEPSLDDFPRQPPLDSLPDEQPRGGLAPWRKVALKDDPILQPASSSDASDARDFERHASPIVFGCGVFGHDMYNTQSTLSSSIPLQTVRLALRYGINSFDTSPYYFPSEFILGNILERLKPEFPRESYFITTKCGRYGPDRQHFDYSAERVESSIRGSCDRIRCGYLDVGLMHDVEFVAEHVGPSNEAGWEAGIISGLVDGAAANTTTTTTAKEQALDSLGLANTPEAASRIHGPGDEKILEAVRTLFKLKDQGVVRRVGISGYPLAVLLRLSRLVASHAPFRPLDVVLSYSNHCLHSDVLVGWRELFEACPAGVDAEAWTPPTVLNGSPFSMGLLVDGPPPAWHPASEELKQACRDASASLRERGESLANTALLYGLRGSELVGGEAASAAAEAPQPQLRTLVGLSTPEHVHSVVEGYRVLCSRDQDGDDEGNAVPQPGRGRLLCQLDDGEKQRRAGAYRKQVAAETEVRRLFQQRGVREWSWSSGL